MILLDDDPQPQERARGEQIKALAVGVPCLFAALPVDCVFYGFGVNAEPIMIGVEVKRPDDMADSVVRSGRLVEQFKRASEYGCTYMYLMHQGTIRPNRSDNMLQEFSAHSGGKPYWHDTRPGMEYSRWLRFVSSLEVKAGIQVMRTNDMWETAMTIHNLYWWWQKPLEEHTSLDRFNQPVQLARKIPLFRKMVKELDGVGWQRSLDVTNQFDGLGLTIPQILSLPAKEFQRVKGIGPVTATSIEQEMRTPLDTKRNGNAVSLRPTPAKVKS